MKVNRINIAFLKAQVGFSYLLSPEEERVIKHLQEIEYFDSIGYESFYSRREYARIMGISILVFDRCVKSLCRMGLIVKTEKSSRNRVPVSHQRACLSPSCEDRLRQPELRPAQAILRLPYSPVGQDHRGGDRRGDQTIVCLASQYTLSSSVKWLKCSSVSEASSMPEHWKYLYTRRRRV